MIHINQIIKIILNRSLLNTDICLLIGMAFSNRRHYQMPDDQVNA